MKQSQKVHSFLSCDGERTQCFLSCTLRYRNNLPNLRKFNQNQKAPSALSCRPSNDSESESNTFPVYRAKQKSLIIGIDPGITGAIAFIVLGQTPQFEAVYDLPTVEVKGKKRLDLVAFALLIETYSKDINLAAIEEVGQIGTKADPFSSFVFGFATGGVHGILSAYTIQIHLLKPLVWKAAIGVTSDKETSLQKARKLFPKAGPFLQRKKDHGRAEALLIAYVANSFSRSLWSR